MSEGHQVVVPRLNGCARCGEDHEEPITFLPFTRASTFGEATITHYAVCPKTQEPILMRIVEPGGA